MAAAAAEAQAEEPSPPPPRAGRPPGRRAPTDGAEGEGQQERPEPKRRRARVAALENVPRAAAVAAAAVAALATASEEKGAGEPADDGCDGGSFSFHARSFSGVETTPKFGSFNPAVAELVAFRLTPPPLPLVDPAETEAGSDEEEAEGKNGNSH